MPRCGRAPPSWNAPPETALEARILVMDDYIILYRVNDADVEIVRVVYGARRLEGLFDADAKC